MYDHVQPWQAPIWNSEIHLYNISLLRVNQAGGAEAKMTFLTPVGLYIFVHPVVFLVHDPYNHVGWFFALQKAPIKKMPNLPP